MSTVRILFDNFRLGRVIMLSLVTGSTAYGFGAGLQSAALAAVLGGLCAAGGFHLDLLADAAKDKLAGKLSNPYASGILSIPVGYSIAGVSLALCISLAVWKNLILLLPCGGVMLVVAGMNAGLLDTPVFRSFSLGLLQALYALMGGIVAGFYGAGILMIALFLLLAMTGGRIIGDVRDLLYDTTAGTSTIPRKYGIKNALIFLWVNELGAYCIGIASYYIQGFATGFLYCMIAIAVCGTILNILFTIKPEPSVAARINTASFSLLGSLFILAMILGR